MTRNRLFRTLFACALAAPMVVPLAAHAGASATTSIATQSVMVDGTRLAYRAIGTRGTAVPLLLLNRFRGTMDDWDPLLIDRIAGERLVLMFDQPGFARSDGTPQASLSGFAATAAQFVRALGYERVDVLGFSMGGTVALQFALDHPQMLRRLVVAGSGPGHVPDQPPGPPASDRVWPIATKPVNDDEDFLFLFFEDSPTSQAAGRAYRQRLRARADAFSRMVEPAAWQSQLKAAQSVGSAATSLLPRLSSIHQPTLVANGRHDIMVPTYNSYAMAQALPQGRLLIYPDSGHGFLFQYPVDFADEVLRFLR